MSISIWNQNNNSFDYAIVEKDCFNASTALALKRKWSNAWIVWFENSITYTVSKDINKIICTLYFDEDYVVFAEQAMRMWEKVASYCNFYHRTSWIQVISENNDRSKMKDLKNRMISIQELLQMIEAHEKSRLKIEKKLWLNENIDYVDSVSAVEAVAEEASSLSVVRKIMNVTRLIVNEEVCLEVETDHFQVIAEKIIVVVDFWTSELLESSKIKFFENFFIIVKIEVTMMSLDETKFSEMKLMLILVTECDMFYFIY